MFPITWVHWFSKQNYYKMNNTQLNKCTNKVKEVTYREPKDDNSFVLKYHIKKKERELIALIHNITNTIYPKL